MTFEFQQGGGGDKGHHARAHHESGHKLHDEAHKLFDKLHHGLQKAKPHLEHAAHAVEHQAKSLGGTAQRELNGTGTASDHRKLATAEKIAGVVFLPHVTIGSVVVKEGVKMIQHSNIKANVHQLEQHKPVNHGDSKH